MHLFESQMNRFSGIQVRSILLLLCVLIALVKVPDLFSTIRRNVLMQQLVPAMLEEKIGRDTYPVVNIEGAAQNGETPLTSSTPSREPEKISSPGLRWTLGRIALAEGDYTLAADMFVPLQDQAQTDPLLFETILVAFAYGGHADSAIALYAQADAPFRSLPPRVSEALAFAHLAQAVQDNWSAAQLQAVLAIRPNDLTAIYYAWRAALAADQTTEAESLYTQLQYRASLPQDAPLWEYALPVLVKMASGNIWKEEKIAAIGSHLAWTYHNANTGLQVLQALVDQSPPQSPQQSQWYYFLGNAYQRKGDLTSAYTEYEKALVGSLYTAVVYERLGRIAQQQAMRANGRQGSLFQQAAHWYAKAHEAKPDDLALFRQLVNVCSRLDDLSQQYDGCYQATFTHDVESPAPVSTDMMENAWLQAAAMAVPDIVVNQSLEEGWKLEGYSVDEQRLVRNEPVDIVLFWQRPLAKGDADQVGDWFKTDSRWVQIIPQVQTLIVGGSFELGMSDGSLPVGSWFDMYQNPSSTRELVGTLRGNIDTTAARLENTETFNDTGYAIEALRIKSNALYLQSGWIRSSLGSGWIGVASYAPIPGGTQRDVSYLVGNYDMDSWQHFAGLQQALVDAEILQVWLLNSRAAGNVDFDNIWLVEIGHP